jgi:hypothetical protein
VLVASIIKAMDGALMMEAANTSETLVNFYQTTQRNNPEDSHLHTCRRENLKSRNNNVSYAHAKSNIYIYVYQWSRSFKNSNFEIIPEE